MTDEPAPMYIFRVISNTYERKRHGYEPDGARAHDSDKYATRFFSEGSSKAYVKADVIEVKWGKRTKDGKRDFEAFTVQNLMDTLQVKRGHFYTEEYSTIWRITYRRYDTLTETWSDEEALVERWVSPPPKRKPSPTRANPARQWLKTNTTHKIPAKGKIPANLMDIYKQAQKQTVQA